MDKIGNILPPVIGSSYCQKHQCNKRSVELAPGFARYICDECENERKIQQFEAIQNRERLAHQAAYTRRIRDAHIPDRFKDATFDNWIPETPQQSDILCKMIEYSRDMELNLQTGRSILITGSQGTGKTHIAIASIKLVCHTHTALYDTAYEAFDRLTSAKFSEERQEQVRQRYIQPDLLVLDEVGIDGEKDTESLLIRIIDPRYLANKPTIIISNLAANLLAQQVGIRIVDRLREHGGFRLTFDWKGHRGKV